MVIMTKEKNTSEDTFRQLEKLAIERQKWEDKQKQSTPEVPDKSGEVGIYDEHASHWFGGGFVYRTESNKYFALTGDGYSFVNPVHLESYFMFLESEKDQK